MMLLAAKRKEPRLFKALTYTARNIAKSVTGVGFKPDLVLVKDRVNANRCPLSASILDTLSATPYTVFPGDYYNLASSAGDYYRDTEGALLSFQEDGFNIGAGDPYCKTAVIDDNFAAWCWKRHPNFFNIIQYQGDGLSSKAVPHGLNSTPKMVWGRRIDTSAHSILVYHASNTANPETDYLKLNTGDATADLNTVWADTAPDSTNITVGTDLNGNGLNYTLWAFAELAGRSKFGTYTGNGSPTGPIIDGLGFNPKFLLIKRTDTGSSHWVVIDENRKNPGVENYYLAIEDTAQEFAGVGVLLGSDQFQPISDNSNTNANGGTYIYYAIG